MKVVPLCNPPAAELGLLMRQARGAYLRMLPQAVRPSVLKVPLATERGNTYLFRIVYYENASQDAVQILDVYNPQIIIPMVDTDWPGSITCFYGPSGGTYWHVSNGMALNTEAVLFAVGGKSSSPIVLSSNPGVVSITSAKYDSLAFKALYAAGLYSAMGGAALTDLVPDFDETTAVYRFVLKLVGYGYTTLKLDQAGIGAFARAKTVFGGNFLFRAAPVASVIEGSGGSVSGGSASVVPYHVVRGLLESSGGSVSGGTAGITTFSSKAAKGGSISGGGAVIVARNVIPPEAQALVTLKLPFNEVYGVVKPLNLAQYCYPSMGGALSFEIAAFDPTVCNVVATATGCDYIWTYHTGGISEFHFYVLETANGITVRSKAYSVVNMIITEQLPAPLAVSETVDLTYYDASNGRELSVTGTAKRGGTLSFVLDAVAAHISVVNKAGASNTFLVSFEPNWHGTTAFSFKAIETKNGVSLYSDAGVLTINVALPDLPAPVVGVSTSPNADGRWHIGDQAVFTNTPQTMPDGTLLTYTWSIDNGGDSILVEEDHATVTFGVQGMVRVTLTVSDIYGRSRYAYLDIDVPPSVAKPSVMTYSIGITAAQAAAGYLLSIMTSAARGGALTYQIVGGSQFVTFKPPNKLLFLYGDYHASTEVKSVLVTVTETADGISAVSDPGRIAVTVGGSNPMSLISVSYDATNRSGVITFSGGSGSFESFMTSSNIRGFSSSDDFAHRKVYYNWTQMSEDDNYTIFEIFDRIGGTTIKLTLAQLGIPPKGTANYLTWSSNGNVHTITGFKVLNGNTNASVSMIGVSGTVPYVSSWNGTALIVTIRSGGCYNPGGYIRVSDLYAAKSIDHYFSPADIYPPPCGSVRGWVEVFDGACDVVASLRSLSWTDWSDFETVTQEIGAGRYQRGGDSIRLTMGYDASNAGNHSFGASMETLLSLGISDPVSYFNIAWWDEYYNLGVDYEHLHVVSIEKYQ